MDPEEVGDNDDLAHLHELEDHLAIFCMATYGEGDPTDNAHEFKVRVRVYCNCPGPGLLAVASGY